MSLSGDMLDKSFGNTSLNLDTTRIDPIDGASIAASLT